MNEEIIKKLKILLDIYELPLPRPLPESVFNYLPRSKGIYFLENDGVLEYVGKASQFNIRLNSHHIYNPEIHKVYIIEIENSILQAAVEAAIIAALKPPLNKEFNPDTIVEELKPSLNKEFNPDTIVEEKSKINDILLELGRLLLEDEIERQKRKIMSAIKNDESKPDWANKELWEMYLREYHAT